MTNEEKLRGMKKSQLASFLNVMCMGQIKCLDCPLYCVCPSFPHLATKEDWLKWLESEVTTL